MRYPNGDETRKEKPHDYRRYYPTHFLPRGHFFAGDSATSTGEAVSERISHNWYPFFTERWLLSSFLSLAQTGLWRLVWRWDFTRENAARTFAQNASNMVQFAFGKSDIFTVIDSYPTELIFSIREGRSEQQVGKKGRNKGRWSIGIKFCWLLNEFCRVVAWDWATMNAYDKHFHPIVEPLIGKTIVLADCGFRDQDGVPENMKICKKGTWNERMCIETTLSMVTIVCDLKRIRNRLPKYIQARLAYVAAMFNILLDLFHRLHPEADPFKMSIAEFAL